MRIKTALLSVSDQKGIVELARQLSELKVKILSTGGTAQAIRTGGIPVTTVSEYTGFPEILDGRIKTLHPRIHAGVLARHDDPAHKTVLNEHGILPIGLVVVNLYPFSRTIQHKEVRLEEAIEQIDIGGPTLIRAAAKNFQYATVMVDPQDYPDVIAEMQLNSSETQRDTRWRLAQKAFQHTAAYDVTISGYLEKVNTFETELPPLITLNLIKKHSLRYGENPHQRAGIYQSQFAQDTGLIATQQRQGKALSFNNYMDLQAAWNLCAEFDDPFCTLIKHTNPCGAAVGSILSDAYQKALVCDPTSAFGSVVGFNREVDGETAEAMSSLFVEAVIAPGYSPGALKKLARKKNLRVIEMKGETKEHTEADIAFDFRKISGGFLIQENDLFSIGSQDLQTVTERTPSDHEIQDLLFAWKVCKHVKSNAIVCASQQQTLGIGAGQMSRLDAVRLATQKAQLRLENCVLASDAFFPFRDGIDEAARMGVKAAIQPGGSIRDKEVIQAADEQGMAMVFTSVRHFTH